MENGQDIYDNWIQIRDQLLNLIDTSRKESSDWTPYVLQLEKSYNVFHKDLIIAGLVKYLDIDVSEKNEKPIGENKEA